MTKRVITATSPDGIQVETSGLGAKRVVGAIRITAAGDWDGTPNTGWAGWAGRGVKYLVTVHKTLENAITGPNQTPAWNSFQRWAIAIDENDQPVGPWLGASK